MNRLGLSQSAVATLNLPVFDGYPYLVVRLQPAFYHFSVAPAYRAGRVLRELARCPAQEELHLRQSDHPIPLYLPARQRHWPRIRRVSEIGGDKVARKRMSMNEKFTTVELVLAAFLQVKGHELLEMQPNGDGKVTFVFRDSEQIVRDAKAYVEDAPIPVRSLSRRIARLRDDCRVIRQGRPRRTYESHRQP